MANDFYRKPSLNLRNLAVDLDGTLAWPTWEPDQRRSVIGDPIPENIAKLMDAHEAGYVFDIHTARPWMDRDMIEEWLTENGIPFRSVICGKPLAHKYVDDKAIDARADRWF